MIETKEELETQLAQVKAAIAKALKAQSYDSEAESVVRPRLETLYAERDRLIKKLEMIEQQNAGGVFNKIKFVRPT